MIEWKNKNKNRRSRYCKQIQRGNIFLQNRCCNGKRCYFLSVLKPVYRQFIVHTSKNRIEYHKLLKQSLYLVLASIDWLYCWIPSSYSNTANFRFIKSDRQWIGQSIEKIYQSDTHEGLGKTRFQRKPGNGTHWAAPQANQRYISISTQIINNCL